MVLWRISLYPLLISSNGSENERVLDNTQVSILPSFNVFRVLSRVIFCSIPLDLKTRIYYKMSIEMIASLWNSRSVLHRRLGYWDDGRRFAANHSPAWWQSAGVARPSGYKSQRRPGRTGKPPRLLLFYIGFSDIPFSSFFFKFSAFACRIATLIANCLSKLWFWLVSSF